MLIGIIYVLSKLYLSNHIFTLSSQVDKVSPLQRITHQQLISIVIKLHAHRLTSYLMMTLSWKTSTKKVKWGLQIFVKLYEIWNWIRFKLHDIYTINRRYVFIHKSFFKLQDIMQHTNRRLQLHIVFQMESSASPLPAFCFLWCVLTPCEEKPISHLIQQILHDCRYAINLVNIMCQKKNYVQLREYIIGSIKFIPCHSATPKITINP